MKKTTYSTPLSQAKGLGAAKKGTAHFTAQRMTAMALMPLGVWLLWSLINMSGLSREGILLWFDNLLSSTLMILALFTALYHGLLGMETIVEDYIHHEKGKWFLLLALKFIAVTVGLAGVLAVLSMSLD